MKQWNRTGIYKRMIFSGSQRKTSDNFVACEARSIITTDRTAIHESYIRRNKLDITVNDQIMNVKAKLDKLRIMNKLG